MNCGPVVTVRIPADAPSASSRQGAVHGRVLRVKFGHNPNSSGIGTSSFALLWGLGVAGLVLNTASAFVLAAWADARGGPEHPSADANRPSA